MDSQGNLAVMPKPKKPRKQSVRVRGQGSLFRRGDMFWMELNWRGTRYRRSLETTDRETALIKLDSEVAAIRAGELPKKFDPITVQSMFDSWMLKVETDCKQRTQEDYRSRWEQHLKQSFGGLTATQVNRDKVVAYLNRRMKEGAGLCARNREQRVLMMLFGHNKSKIPADRFPEFPKMQSEKSHVRKGRLSKEDYDTLRKRLDDPKLFWLRAFVTLTFTYGFRRSELIGAKVGYFNPKASTLTLPAFTTKNKMERIVDINPDGEIHNMLVRLAEGRDADAALFTRNGRPVKDYRGEWARQTKDIKGGSGKGGAVTLHDLRRSAITNMSEKGVTAAQAGTHLTPDVFARYISRDLNERRNTAKIIEG
ncbi:MAG TPA: site-specific integrase [Candidatus Acidoferrales bacterium]|nr:site-specific integrase [Candidatus Acidoferrales bacterium]